MNTRPYEENSTENRAESSNIASIAVISALTAAAIIFLGAGCATTTTATMQSIVNDPSNPPRIIPAAIPMPVKTIEVFDSAAGRRKEADVLSLTSAQIRDRLTQTDTLISVEQRDASGSFKYLSAGAKAGKGIYRVTIDYVNSTTQDVTFGDGKKAVGQLAVGLRIVANLETFDTGLDLNGLWPISVAFQSRKVSGSLNFQAYGISNPKISVVVPSSAPLDAGSIQKSFEAAATVRALFGDNESRLEPYLIGVSGVAPTESGKALAAASKQLTES